MSEKKNYAKDYYPSEIMASFMARNLKGFNSTGVGTLSLVPIAAIRLAQTTHSPNLWCRNGPAASLNGKMDKLAEYIGDYRFHVGAEARFSLEYVMDTFGDPKISPRHLYYRGGFQIDKYGNVNMTFIGTDARKPKFRGPGTVGLMAMGMGRSPTDLFTGTHTPRIYVEKVDFISGPGYGTGPGWRESMDCPPGGGPRYVITPICIFDFDEETKIMRIKSIHPGHTVEEVLQRTGFKPIVPAKIPETEPPTVEEVEFFRALDPDGFLPKLAQ
jgi:glutaconate CoA-transferase, subunit B